MSCRQIHDDLHSLFRNVDADDYILALRNASYMCEDWSPLLGHSAERDAALKHAASCHDCLDDIFQFLEIRDKVDYRQFPCLHIAYYSTIDEVKCIDVDVHGLCGIVLSGKEAESIVIGHCPWCGIPLPTGIS